MIMYIYNYLVAHDRTMQHPQKQTLTSCDNVLFQFLVLLRMRHKL